jgi:F-type H+-transporting ATPase subunit epsilon
VHVELVSPERILFSGEAQMVVARTIEGDIAFLENHAPFIGALDIGPVMIRKEDGTDEHAAVHGGFVEVSNNRVTILSDLAELASQIDLDRARREADELERHVRDNDDAEVSARLRRANARIAVAGR